MADHPAPGIFIAESPLVIGRALDAGYEPLAFLVIQNGDVRLIQLSSAESSLNNLIGMVPTAVDRIGALLNKKKAEKAPEETPEEPAQA